jgi:endonuclease/exonuclease/phosphatase (EEP) superfamily protein YafD
VILFGDLNVTPWSPYFADLLKHGGLKDTSQGRGLFGSWPSWLPGLRIPLDHCLTSPAILVADKRLGPKVGSDHLPMMIDLIVTSSRGD